MVRVQVIRKLFEIIIVLQGATVDKAKVVWNISEEVTNGYSLYPHTGNHGVFPKMPLSSSFVLIYPHT
jgi:hypothetical protein